MSIDERLEALTQSVELLASLHRDNEKLMAQVLESIARLANVAAAHETRLNDLEGNSGN